MHPFIDDYVDHFEVGFEQFRLRPGLELEVHDESGRPLEHHAQFVMAYPGKGVLVSLRVNDPDRIAMQPGVRYQLSGFNGKFDFSFTAEAQKVDRAQFTALLAAPATVTIRFVRRHHRTALALPAAVSTRSAAGASPVTIRNLSMGGAGVSSVQPLGATGDSVTLRLQITFENQKEGLDLAAVIRRSGPSHESIMFDTGLEFVNASRVDKLLLHYYLTTLANEYHVI